MLRDFHHEQTSGTEVRPGRGRCQRQTGALSPRGCGLPRWAGRRPVSPAPAPRTHVGPGQGRQRRPRCPVMTAQRQASPGGREQARRVPRRPRGALRRAARGLWGRGQAGLRHRVWRPSLTRAWPPCSPPGGSTPPTCPARTCAPRGSTTSGRSPCPCTGTAGHARPRRTALHAHPSQTPFFVVHYFD